MRLEDLTAAINTAKANFITDFLQPLGHDTKSSFEFIEGNCVVDVNPDKVRVINRNPDFIATLKANGLWNGAAPEVMRTTSIEL